MVDGQRELCLIKNISEGGMMIRAYNPIGQGKPVAIELKSGQMVAGTVAWIRESNVGIEFDSPIDVIEMLSTATDGARPRMPRIEAGCFAIVREGANTYRMRVLDISQGGIKVETDIALPASADVAITLPELEPQAGAVRWCEDGCAGLTFNRVLPLASLIEWLRTRRTQMRSAN